MDSIEARDDGRDATSETVADSNVAPSSIDAAPDGPEDSAESGDGAAAPSDAALSDADDAAAVGRDADAGGDSEVGGEVHCSRSQPFGVPALVPSVNTVSGSVFAARFSPDELTVYLGMLHGPNFETFFATRPSRADQFAAPQPVDPINDTNSVNDFATVTGDGLALYFESSRSGTFGLYASERTSRTSDFSTPVAMTILNGNPSGNPYVLPDGSALYYHTYRSGNFDIYRASRATSGFESPAPIDIDTTGDEMDPVVSADDLTIYYGRPSDGTPIWKATRQSKSDPFSNPVPLSELNGPLSVRVPVWISPDECRLYIQERDSLGGIFIYVAERTPDVAP
jgi:hypothetical protein